VVLHPLNPNWSLEVLILAEGGNTGESGDPKSKENQQRISRFGGHVGDIVSAVNLV
jgi:hypothetical protein